MIKRRKGCLLCLKHQIIISLFISCSRIFFINKYEILLMFNYVTTQVMTCENWGVIDFEIISDFCEICDLF